MKNKILLIEKNELIYNTIENQTLKLNSHLEFIISDRNSDISELIKKFKEEIFIVIIDIKIEDCIDCNIIKLIEASKIPYIMFSDNEYKENITFNNYYFIEYLNKNDFESFSYISKRINEIYNNKNKTILLVDDSNENLKHTEKFLSLLNYKIVKSTSVKNAFALLESKIKNLKMIITSHNDKRLNGLEFVYNLRKDYSKDILPIIAYTNNYNSHILKEFYRLGANDFLNKNHPKEELLLRVKNHMDILELFQKNQNLLHKDYLSDIYNRRYFFETAKNQIKKSLKKKSESALMIFDIDNFKNINDSYGHSIGDLVINKVAQKMNDMLRAYDLFARFGGEEYILLLEDITYNNVVKLIEKLRFGIEELIIHDFDDNPLSVTVSIGVVFDFLPNLEYSIIVADKNLYEAKRTGKNKYIISSLSSYS